jgi:hypothetical protein
MNRGTLTTFSLRTMYKYFYCSCTFHHGTLPWRIKYYGHSPVVFYQLWFSMRLSSGYWFCFALKGVDYKLIGASAILANLLIYGLGGLIIPFIGIKIIDLVVCIIYSNYWKVISKVICKKVICKRIRNVKKWNIKKQKRLKIFYIEPFTSIFHIQLFNLTFNNIL